MRHTDSYKLTVISCLFLQMNNEEYIMSNVQMRVRMKQNTTFIPHNNIY